MQVFLGIAYFVIGIVQLFAISDGIGYALNTGKIISFILASFLTYIPLLGSVLGVYGAVNAWHWNLLQAATLFFWYVPIVILLSAFGALSRR
jgi:hypothetical protein